MASSWIKVEVITPDKPEVYQLAELLELDPDAVLGKLIRLWSWADQQTIDGNADCNAVSVTKSAIDRITFVRGFAEAMLKVGWLALDGESWFFQTSSGITGIPLKNGHLQIGALQIYAIRNAVKHQTVTLTALQKRHKRGYQMKMKRKKKI